MSYAFFMHPSKPFYHPSDNLMAFTFRQFAFFNFFVKISRDIWKNSYLRSQDISFIFYRLHDVLVAIGFCIENIILFQSVEFLVNPDFILVGSFLRKRAKANLDANFHQLIINLSMDNSPKATTIYKFGIKISFG